MMPEIVFTAGFCARLLAVALAAAVIDLSAFSTTFGSVRNHTHSRRLACTNGLLFYGRISIRMIRNK